MGGYSSGRYRTRNQGAVEAAYRLDMRALRRAGFIRPNATTSGSWGWTCRGQPSGSIGLSIWIGAQGEGEAVLSFSVNGQPSGQRVAIVSTPCRYGGRRYYFLCPASGRRCEVLCFARGAFACRQAQRLSYHSQSEDQLGRLYRARDKARARLDGGGDRPRPRGANRERLVQRWIDLEEAADDLFAATAIRRFRLDL